MIETAQTLKEKADKRAKNDEKKKLPVSQSISEPNVK